MADTERMKTVYFCTNRRYGVDSPSCAMRGSEKVMEMVKQELSRRGKSFPVEKFLCLGQCTFGPAVRIAPGGEFFLGAKKEKFDELLEWIIAEMEK
ncbi:MAG: (2Fe-2S) ferredoxin domain-containing protein [Methylocystaceae bacterium]|nr:(2Fe-2S) ferredoxin domain-containing protein [Methylocystaceae bacterium]